MTLYKIPIISSVSVEGIIRYSISHPIGSLFATCSLEMLTTNALLIGSEVVLENERFSIVSVNKKPHRRGQPRTVELQGRSKADVFELTTIDNDLTYLSFTGLNTNQTLYDGFTSPDQSPLNQGGKFLGHITKAKTCDCFGGNGWTAVAVIQDLIQYTQIARVEIACQDYDILRVDFSAGMSVVEGARQLFGMFDPFIYATAQAQATQGGGSDVRPTLYILPTSEPQPYDWPGGQKIDQSVDEEKIDRQYSMIIIEGGAEPAPGAPNPCPSNCRKGPVADVINNWKNDAASAKVNADDVMARSAWAYRS